MQGVVRMDYLVSGKQVYLCEVNTVPGSLAYYLFCERITEARSLFCGILHDAMDREIPAKKVVATGILQTVTWNGK
jgi:D-alanine-D-alanine ligase-like ATP-grasp enzyme